MPIREQEVQCFPDTLLSGDWEPQTDHRWWVVHTKARQEKSIARDLLAQEIPYFLPQIAKTSIVGGRKRTSHIPLFTSYVFLYGTEEQRYRSFKTNRVAQILAVEQQNQLYDDLRQVWRLIEDGTPLTPESRLQPGDRVRVCGGSLDGIEGTVIARRKKCRLLVAVRLLQQGVSVEVDDFMLEPIG